MPQPITMTYRNWRGEVAERTIIPGHIWLGTTEWHPQPGYLLNAIDVEKGEARDFALADCQFADLRVPAPAVPDDVAAYRYARQLALDICDRGYRESAAGWQPLPDLLGVLTQIDNMTAGLLSTIEAQAAELARLRDDRYRLAYAICGGEDAHGLLDATPVEALERLARDEDRAHGEAIDRVLKLQAELARLNDKLKLEYAITDAANIKAAAAEDENRTLRASLQRCLDFMDNMEREIGTTLEIANDVRAALTQPTGDRTNGI